MARNKKIEIDGAEISMIAQDQFDYISLTDMLIGQGLNQSEQLSQLNQIAITQMISLVNHANLKKLK